MSACDGTIVSTSLVAVRFAGNGGIRHTCGIDREGGLDGCDVATLEDVSAEVSAALAPPSPAAGADGVDMTVGPTNSGGAVVSKLVE